MPYKIAVTGANGLVGSGFVKLALESGHSILALDLSPTGNPPLATGTGTGTYEYVQLSATDFEAYRDAVESAGCDVLVHLAAAFNRHDGQGKFVTDVGSHVVANSNTNMSWNTLEIAAQLGINRVVLASSVNSIGMVFSQRPRFDYLPIDENHPHYPEDAYSVSKYVCEIQADAFVRCNPKLRVSTLRFHAVTADEACTVPALASGGAWKDLWGWVSVTATAQSILLSITAPETTFPLGHETFFIVAGTTKQQCPTRDLLQEKYPELVDEFDNKVGGRSNVGLISTKKAERMLGWKEVFDNAFTAA